MTTLYALPYDISASGFYFKSVDEFQKKFAENKSEEGYPIEEYEIQFIDGETIDAQLFNALYVNQVNHGYFLAACDEWDDDQKAKIIIAVGEVGYEFDLESDTPDKFEIDIYEMDSLKELAEHFVDEGILGEIPDNMRYYFDYEAFARDLAVEYSETTIAGKKLIYRCD